MRLETSLSVVMPQRSLFKFAPGIDFCLVLRDAS